MSSKDSVLEPEDVRYGMRVKGLARGGGYGTIVNNACCKAFNPDWDQYVGASRLDQLVYPGYQGCLYVRVWWDEFDIPSEFFLHKMAFTSIEEAGHGPHNLHIAMYAGGTNERR